MKLSFDPLIAFVLLLVVLYACGGGGANEGVVAAPGTVAPSLTVSGPDTGGTTDAERIVVRGTADPGTGAIAAIRVNGRPATSSDGFATWAASVPLAFGANSFVVTLEDASGGTTDTPLGVEIERVPPIFVGVNAVAVDPVTKRAYVADPVRGEVYLFDADTGNRKTVSGPSLGSGPGFFAIHDLEFDPTNDRLLVLDGLLSAIVEVSLQTGDRRILVATPGNEAPSLGGARAIAMIPGTTEVLALSVTSGLVEVDLATGERTSVSNNDDHPGEPFVSPRGLAYDPLSGLAYVVDSTTKDVLAVELASGKRVVHSEDGVAPGQALGVPLGCELVPGQGLVVVDSLGQLVVVSLASGARSRISGFGTGAGDEFVAIRTVAAIGTDFLLPDVAADGVWRVDGDSGDRELLGELRLGEGDPLSFVSAIATDSLGNLVAAVTTGNRDEVVSIDPRTGDRTVISGTDVGSGGDFAPIRSLDVHPETGELLVVDGSVRQFIVDPETGERQALGFTALTAPVQMPFATWVPGNESQTLFLNGETGFLSLYNLRSGEVDPIALDLEALHSATLDFDGRRLFCAENERILAVELPSGSVTVVTDADDSVGGGYGIATIGDLEFDEARGVLYYHDEDRIALVAVDVETGERTLVSSAQRGSGPPFPLLGGLGASPDGESLYLYASSLRAILAIDVDSGDRFVLAR